MRASCASIGCDHAFCLFFFLWRYDRYMTHALVRSTHCPIAASANTMPRVHNCMHALSESALYHRSIRTRPHCMRCKTIRLFFFFSPHVQKCTAVYATRKCADLPWTRRKCRKTYTLTHAKSAAVRSIRSGWTRRRWKKWRRRRWREIEMSGERRWSQPKLAIRIECER